MQILNQTGEQKQSALRALRVKRHVVGFALSLDQAAEVSGGIDLLSEPVLVTSVPVLMTLPFGTQGEFPRSPIIWPKPLTI